MHEKFYRYDSENICEKENFLIFYLKLHFSKHSFYYADKKNKLNFSKIFNSSTAFCKYISVLNKMLFNSSLNFEYDILK